MRIENKDKDEKNFRTMIGMFINMGCAGGLRKRIGMGEDLGKG